ncbi:hypothetical protein SAMN06272735_3215 [Streptomyces sp. TLI_55]|nr:hypothetical protein SAMN06272735_3215 [Streptomyces sp. TLI_55]
MSETGEQPVERSRHPILIERLDENAPITDLAPLLRTEKPPELLLRSPPLLRRLLQKDLQRPRLPLLPHELPHPRHPQRPDELILKIRRANKDPLLPRTAPLKSTHVIRSLPLITQPHKPKPQPGGPEQPRIAPHIHGPTHGQHAHPLPLQIPPPPLREGIDGGNITKPLKQHDDPNAQHPSKLSRRPPIATTPHPRGDGIPERPHVSHETSLSPHRPRGEVISPTPTHRPHPPRAPTSPTRPPTTHKPPNPPGVQARRPRARQRRPTETRPSRQLTSAARLPGPPARFSPVLERPGSRVARRAIGAADAQRP